MSYKEEYLGNFNLSDQGKELERLAKEYHKETDSYDDKVCSVKNERGVPMPANSREYVLINQNALRVRKRILDNNPQINRKDFHNAVVAYGRYL